MNSYPLFSLFFLLINTITYPELNNHTVNQLTDTTYRMTLEFTLAPNDFIYHDYLNLSVDNPHVNITNWQPSSEPVTYYDSAFKENKKIYPTSFTIHVFLQSDQSTMSNTNLHVSYYQHSKKQIVTELFPLESPTPVQEPLQTNKSVQDQLPTNRTTTPSSSSWFAYLANLMEKTNSLVVRIILSLLLGMVLSLTPCIYPMIPITAGILNAHASCSLIKNFLRSCAYTMGLATTFATLGLAAAFTGQLLGSLLMNPIVILVIVSLLLYLAGSMIGLYEMYIPPFLRNNNANMQGGSLISAFIFGIFSGTIASPCISPGLILLLSLVATIGNAFIGFLLLFAFGIGLSIPLLIIGTLSSSLNILPRAGMWMVEIKQLFGFMLLGMSFYFLNNILPLTILFFCMACTTLAIGIFYLYTASKSSSSPWKQIKNCVGIFAIASFIFLNFKTYEFYVSPESLNTLWITEYDQALALAKQQKKYIFLEVSAPYCSICKSIEKKLLQTPTVTHCLYHYIPVKIDGSDNEHPIHSKLLKQYKIVGVPTYLLINPTDGSVIARWASELYEHTPEQFIAMLKNYKTPESFRTNESIC